MRASCCFRLEAQKRSTAYPSQLPRHLALQAEQTRLTAIVDLRPIATRSGRISASARQLKTQRGATQLCQRPSRGRCEVRRLVLTRHARGGCCLGPCQAQSSEDPDALQLRT